MIDSEGFRAGIFDFYEKRKIDPFIFRGYSFKPGLLPTYWSTSYPVLAYSLIGILDEMDNRYKDDWAHFLKKGQDPETGLFHEPIDENNAPFGPVHSSSDILLHGATFITGALHALGHKPDHGFLILEKYKKSGAIASWIESLPWQNPWKTGNYTYDLGCLLGVDYGITGNIKNIDAIDEFFDWMDRNTDKDTGWWNPKGNAPLYSQQFGGYHTLMVYWMFGREVPDPEKMIRSTLKLQDSDGSYSGYGCCGDMDAVDTIVTLSRQYGICEREVKHSIERFYPYLMLMLDEDGGFISLNESIHADLGWKLHTGKKGKSDACSTYFRTFTLSLCDEILDLPWLDGVEWKHMDGFCHGIRPKNII